MPHDEEDNEELAVTIDTDDNYEIITISFVSQERNVSIGFGIQEAQLLSLMLGEAVTAALLNKMQLFPDPSDKIH
jgi:hypothetical protein